MFRSVAAALSLICLIAAPAMCESDDDEAATARLRGALQKMPGILDDLRLGFALEGEILVGGEAHGTFVVAAKPARLPDVVSGAHHWRLEERHKWGQGDEAVDVHHTAYVTRDLAPVQGVTQKIEFGETSTWTWARKEKRLRIVQSGPSVRPMERFVEDKRAAFTTMASAILFALRVAPESALYVGESFHPDFNLLLGQQPLAPVSLAVEGSKTWRGRPAFLVTGRWKGQDLTLALDPERGAPLGWRLVRKDAPPVDYLPKKKENEKEPAGDVFTQPAKSAQAAAIRAGFSFSTNDMDVLADVIHWPTLRKRMGDQVPASVTPEAFRSGLLKRIEETAKNPQQPALMRTVLKGMMGTLQEEKTEAGVVVTFPPMFRSLKVTVAEIGGVWYLVELP